MPLQKKNDLRQRFGKRSRKVRLAKAGFPFLLHLLAIVNNSFRTKFARRYSYLFVSSFFGIHYIYEQFSLFPSLLSVCFLCSLLSVQSIVPSVHKFYFFFLVCRFVLWFVLMCCNNSYMSRAKKCEREKRWEACVCVYFTVFFFYIFYKSTKDTQNEFKSIQTDYYCSNLE